MYRNQWKSIAAGVVICVPLLGAAASAQQQPATPDTTTPMTGAEPGAATTSPPASSDSAMSGKFLTEQKPGQISANTYIGKAVYNAKNENVGDINDLIIDAKNGGAIAAVIGVGGFLGIGEKEVAVPVDDIKVDQNAESGDLKLTTSETAESLKAAPDFKTLAAISAEKRAQMPAQPQDGMTQTPSLPQQ